MNVDLSGMKRLLKSAVTENMGLKGVAAVIAIGLYLLVMYQEEAERILDVEVLWNLPEPTSGIVLSTELIDKVRLRLRGPRSTVESIRPGELRPLDIDLRDKQEGTYQHYFAEEDFEIPTRTEFVRVTPESVLVKLESLVSRSVPVRVRMFGKLESGTELKGDPIVTPTAVSVIGPSSAMRDITAVETEDIDIDGIGVGEHIQIVPAKWIEGVSIRGGDELRVGLNVRWIPGERILPRLPLTVRGTELSAELRPPEVAVGLKGPQIALEKIEPATIVPVIVIPEEQRHRLGVYLGNVTLEGIPDNITVSSITPNKVKVKLTMAGALKKREP
ncbi:MAG: hypothetical protein QNJ97_22165 [Myxococcota bacterium]|nr:hypothetical protein [Myxococcota bacterium]